MKKELQQLYVVKYKMRTTAMIISNRTTMLRDYANTQLLIKSIPE